MLRIILGVIVGFIVWSVLWGGVSMVIVIRSQRLDAPTLDNDSLITLLVLSIICSLVSGFLAALIAKENTKSTLILGVLLLLVGIFFEVMAWNQASLWYHSVFLVLLIPMTILGGKSMRNKP